MRTKTEINTHHLATMNILNRYDAKAVTGVSSYDYSIQTIAGELQISLNEDCAVCTRFTDVERAKGLDLGDKLNPHSGKWNWMGGLDHNGDMLDLANFSSALRKIT